MSAYSYVSIIFNNRLNRKAFFRLCKFGKQVESLIKFVGTLNYTA